ncbi:hypothetical protein VPH35_084749 [Triticum aestivum]
MEDGSQICVANGTTTIVGDQRGTSTSNFSCDGWNNACSTTLFVGHHSAGPSLTFEVHTYLLPPFQITPATIDLPHLIIIIHSYSSYNPSTSSCQPVMTSTTLLQSMGNDYYTDIKVCEFCKQIMYASRKASADTRKRIKGRFAKATNEHQHILHSDAA